MTHESPVSPRSVAFKDNETTSRAIISFFIYKVLRLRPLGMVGFEPTAQIPLTAEYTPMKTIIEVYPFGLVTPTGLEPILLM